MTTFEKSIVNSFNKITIPSYQRAYAWEEKQITQFINDLIEVNDKMYYYGHFIGEINNEEKTIEIIDGQQRITTFILLLLSGKLFLDIELNTKLEDLIKNKFQTIDYDKAKFKELLDLVFAKNIKIDGLEIETTSFKRIIEAIKIFKKLFESKGLKKEDIEKYITTLLNAEVSVHTTNDKKVAVQIFELQNSRGIELDLIEKVKAKLMKEVYLHSNENESQKIIQELQKDFAEIYKYEEKIDDSNLRGNLTLDRILLHHLRVIDDGNKREKVF